jgi:hypothetical protein
MRIRRVLMSVTVAATLGTALGLAPVAASAMSRHGGETVKAAIYEVNGTGTGWVKLSGTVRGSGNVAEEPSLPSDPANSSRALIAVPQGTFTVLSTGGTDIGPNVGPNCSVTFAIKGQMTTVVSGTGLFANATGTFRGNIFVTGYLARLSTGACDESPTSAPLFDIVYVNARGHVNLGQSST